MSSEKIVLYFFQGDLSESQEAPNAVLVPFQGKSLTFDHFKSAFPRKYNQSNLHFRFKKEDSQFGYVWIDIRNPAEPLPSSGGIIMAKILKLDEVNTSKRKTRLRRRLNVDNGVEGAKANTNLATSVANSSHSGSRYDEDEGDEQEDIEVPEDPRQTASNSSTTPGRIHPAASAATSSSTPGRTQVRDPSSAPSAKEIAQPVPSPVRVANLLDDSDSTPQPAQQLQRTPPPTEPVDMMNFGDASPKPTAASNKSSASSSASSKDGEIDEKSFGTGGLTREELIARREADIAAKVQAAREFKDDCDEKAKSVAEEIEVAKAKHDKVLDAWATNNKEKRNVRTLLTTMHTVLWPDNNWKPIGLGDVIDSSKVKLQYRKAMLVVHPDKCSNKSPEIQFIAKRLFEAINEAYQEFLKKEGV